VDLETTVLAAATAVVGIALVGIIVISRSGGMREAAYVGLPAVAIVVLFVLAWLEVTG